MVPTGGEEGWQVKGHDLIRLPPGRLPGGGGGCGLVHRETMRAEQGSPRGVKDWTGVGVRSPPVWLWFSLSSARAVSSELRDLRW